MKLTSIIAIYTLFWSLSFFLVLPFRLRPRGIEDAHVRGQMPGAPPPFSFGRTCLWTTIVAAILFALYYGNYVFGWVPVENFDVFHRGAIGGR